MKTRVYENNARVDVAVPERSAVRLSFLIGAIVLAALVLAYAIRSHYNRKAAVIRCVCCADNLQKIGRALLAYRDVYGQLPPRYTTDVNGRPLLSWRVLVLPYLGAQEKTLFKSFDLNKPWNAEANRRLMTQMPNVFRCPGEVVDDAWCTNYVMVVGGEWLPLQGYVGTFGKNQPFIIEVSHQDIVWSEPRDLSESEIARLIAVPADARYPRNHGNVLNVMSVDAAVATWEVTEELTFFRP